MLIIRILKFYLSKYFATINDVSLKKLRIINSTIFMTISRERDFVPNHRVRKR